MINKKTPRVFQVMDAIMAHDAVSDDALSILGLLREKGYESQIFSMWSDEETVKKRKDFYQLPDIQSDDIIIFHFSGYSPLVERVKSLNCVKILRYHNITPASFFQDYSTEAFEHCAKGRAQLKTLLGYFDHCIGDSDFNCLELQELGFKSVTTIPIFLSPDAFTCSRAIVNGSHPADHVTKWLFVGRFAPNKKQDDIIKSFYLYHRYYNQASRLTLIGSSTHSPLYFDGLVQLVRYLGIEDCVDFISNCPHEKLCSYYQTSDLFVCLSEHEGFCVPLLEAMSAGLPVVAYDSSAVGETLGKKHPLLLAGKDYQVIAETARRALTEPKIRQRTVDFQIVQLERFDIVKSMNKLIHILSGIKSVVMKGTKSNTPRFSIIINTYDRYQNLVELMPHLEQLTYPEFEVIIVNGPSHDDTYKLKELYPSIKYVEVGKTNISLSRNAGIRAAAGEYLAFIDDDAIPHWDTWLEQFLTEFKANSTAGAVGGPVKIKYTEYYEFRRGRTSDYGRQIFQTGESGADTVSMNWVDGVQGANNALRRDCMIEIGGFDEVYEYYLDETDVCFRLKKAGYSIANSDTNYVHHFKAESTVRGNGFDLKWYKIARSTGYFCMKTGHDMWLVRLFKSMYFLHPHMSEIVAHWRAGQVTFRKMLVQNTQYLWGGMVGIFRGAVQPRKTPLKNYSNTQYPFVNFKFKKH